MPHEGQPIGPYQLVRKLGGGAFGEVWLAQHREWADRQCAIKLPTDPDYVAQLRREGNIVHHLRHPNVVEAVDIDLRHDPPYFVMEYVEGQDLRKRLREAGKLPVEEALGIVCQILEALKAAHAEGVLHRDLKPENILLTPEGAVKVTDFGLGKVQAEVAYSLMLSGSMLTKEGASVSGTVQYMSPEQQAAADPDPRDDLYALGIMGCELLTGGRPTASGIARAMTRAGLPQDLAAPFDKACDDREYRYASAEEMLRALEQASSEVSKESPRQHRMRFVSDPAGAEVVLDGASRQPILRHAMDQDTWLEPIPRSLEQHDSKPRSRYRFLPRWTIWLSHGAQPTAAPCAPLRSARTTDITRRLSALSEAPPAHGRPR